ncbi:Sensor protein CitS [Pelotomaculum sp. FP]|nr:Sensor protein CitS [Pelotomaculum sp. FP]
MDKMTILQLLCVSLPEAMLVAALGITLAGFRPRLGQLFIIGMFHALASYIIRLSQVPFGLHTILLLLAFILIIHAVTRLNLITSTLAGLAGLTVFAAVETLIAPQLLGITGYTYEQALDDPLLRICFFLPEAAAILLIIIFCRRHRINILSYLKKAKQTGGLTISRAQDLLDEDFYIRQYFPLIALVLSPILLLALLNSTFFLSRAGSISELYLNSFTTFISLAVVLLTGLSAVAIKRIARIVEVECTAKQTAETISQMEELIYSIRKQRHDFNHHLQAVYGFLEVGSSREARDYIRNTFNAISTRGELIKTDNHEISAMLYTKISLAEAKNMNLEVLINCSLKDLPLKSGEANSVLGNLIDNAMEAVGSASGERRLINVEITKPSNAFVFAVANRGKPIEPEIIDRIFEPNFSTKKGRPGLGLAIVKELVERYNGSVTVSSNDEETIFTVRLPAKK